MASASLPVADDGSPAVVGAQKKLEVNMSNEIRRRTFIQGTGALIGGAIALNEPSVNAETVSSKGAKSMTYEAKPLSLDPKAIKGISEKVLVSHYENNYYLPARRRRGPLSLRKRKSAESIAFSRQVASSSREGNRSKRK